MRFEEDCPMPTLIQKVPHIAFEVQDIEKEIREKKLTVLTPVNSPAKGISVAMIEHNGPPLNLYNLIEKNNTGSLRHKNIVPGYFHYYQKKCYFNKEEIRVC